MADTGKPPLATARCDLNFLIEARRESESSDIRHPRQKFFLLQFGSLNPKATSFICWRLPGAAGDAAAATLCMLHGCLYSESLSCSEAASDLGVGSEWESSILVSAVTLVLNLHKISSVNRHYLLRPLLGLYFLLHSTANKTTRAVYLRCY
jgi:hypothetical protein